MRPHNAEVQLRRSQVTGGVKNANIACCVGTAAFIRGVGVVFESCVPIERGYVWGMDRTAISLLSLRCLELLFLMSPSPPSRRCLGKGSMGTYHLKVASSGEGIMKYACS